jgi:hypothetical protein
VAALELERAGIALMSPYLLQLAAAAGPELYRWFRRPVLSLSAPHIRQTKMWIATELPVGTSRPASDTRLRKMRPSGACFTSLPRCARTASPGSKKRARQPRGETHDRQRLDLGALDEPVVALRTRARVLKLVPETAGTRGYDDLCRHASREPLGHSLRPQVASPDDLARMLGALDQPEQLPTLLRLRRLIELGRERNRGWSREGQSAARGVVSRQFVQKLLTAIASETDASQMQTASELMYA